MEIFSDLHIHSRFSRATSSDISIESLEKWARVKGLNLLGTGDFTHPVWFSELKERLQPERGILKTATGFSFIATTEISNIFLKNGKQRRVHNIIIAPDLEVVGNINDWLSKKGRLDYDGRPIFSMDCQTLIEGLIDIDPWIEIIPAHAWTPWYGIFGSKTGFDSIEDCFGDFSKYIHAIETGLSSDPAMNWRLSTLDRYSLVSFSDAHSYWPWRLGRECTVFSCEMDYKSIIRAIRDHNITFTIEVSPAYGKYHWDGHRSCGVCLKPKTAEVMRNLCPVCKRPLTMGVLHRVETLSDRPDGFTPSHAKPFFSIIPLSEIISNVTKSAVNSVKVWEIYNKLIERFNNEFYVLLKAGLDEIENLVGDEIARLIDSMRSGKIQIQPGYDGVYGVITETEPKENIPKEIAQQNLSSFFRPAQI
ncbi:MAG: endonuclease Q family protein [Candidatus Aenigmatarchaeota archaeon]